MDWWKRIKPAGVTRVLLMIAYLAGMVVLFFHVASTGAVKLRISGPVWLLVPWAYSDKARSFWGVVSLVVSVAALAVADLIVLVPPLSRLAPAELLIVLAGVAVVAGLSAGVNQALANEEERRRLAARADASVPTQSAEHTPQS